jgi:hypothetical protein
MPQGPTCKALVFSWLLGIGGLTLMNRFGHLGFVLALGPLAVAQHLRGDHDKQMLDRYRDSTWAKGFALVYYMIIFAACAIALSRRKDPGSLPSGVIMVAFFFPFIVGMLVTDHATCSQRVGTRQDS